jgi:hypothetical protein
MAVPLEPLIVVVVPQGMVGKTQVNLRKAFQTLARTFTREQWNAMALAGPQAAVRSACARQRVAAKRRPSAK